MEDAAIHETDLGDGNCLFGVFDGHGGTDSRTQDMKLASMSKKVSLLSSQNQTSIRKKNT